MTPRLHDPRSAAVGELDPIAVECAAARAEIRGRFASAVERARTWTLLNTNTLSTERTIP